MNIRSQDRRVFIYDAINPPSFLVAQPTDADEVPDPLMGCNLSAIGLNSTRQEQTKAKTKDKLSRSSTQQLKEIELLQTFKSIDPRELTLTQKQNRESDRSHHLQQQDSDRLYHNA